MVARAAPGDRTFAQFLTEMNRFAEVNTSPIFEDYRRNAAWAATLERYADC